MAMSAYYAKSQFYLYLIPLNAVLEGKGFSATGEDPSDSKLLAEQSTKAKAWIEDLVCVRETDFKRFIIHFKEEQTKGHLSGIQLNSSALDAGEHIFAIHSQMMQTRNTFNCPGPKPEWTSRSLSRVKRKFK